MIKSIVLVVLAAVVLVLAYAATRADSFRVERSTRIKAAPERVFALINDLTRMRAWNPFEKKDPGLKGQFGTTTAGAGASYAWQSEKVGVGSMTILESTAPSSVKMRLDFIKPFAAQNMAEYTLKAEGETTQVTWAMYGPAPFSTKLMQVFISMDRMVGKDFEDGLANLKTLAETP